MNMTANQNMNRLIDALARSLPQFDPALLHAHPPEMEDGGDAETIAGWLYEHLEAQGLADTLEWGQFNGEMPALKPLADLDFSAFDAFWNVAYEAAAGTVAMPWDRKFLEVMNGILQPHGLAIAELVTRETGDCATLLCVGTDAAALEALRHRGKIDALASRMTRLTRPQTVDRKEDATDRLFGGLAENLSARLLAEHLAELPALQG